MRVDDVCTVAFVFHPLTPEECYLLPDGMREDICNDCARMEAEEQNARTNSSA